MADVWMCSNCNQAVPVGDWPDHREAHLNEYQPERHAS